MSRTLATIVSEPERIDSVGPDDLPGLIGEVEALKARLWARLQATGTPRAPAPTPTPSKGPDVLLTASECAKRLGVSVRWVYRKADELPFTRRIGAGTLRFSAHALEKWKEARR